ncbi:MAG: hypothetical protein ACYS80_27145, partial [Planctomycetota bacterium]
MKPISITIIHLLLTFALPASLSALEVSNVKHSATKHLGQDGDFARTGAVLLANADAWGRAGKSGSISYRMVRAKAEADLRIAAFDVDSSGFCTHSMILEVFYRDNLKLQRINANRAKGQPVIQSRIDFSKDNEYVEVGHLKCETDGKWKVARVFLERTPRQMVRAIDGSFQFRIAMPASGSEDLAVSHVRLISLEQEEFIRLREKERAERGLRRVDYQGSRRTAAASGEWKSRGLVVYPVNYLELVFPNSAVDYERAGSELKCFEVPGQAEPISLVVHGFGDLSNVQVKVSDLHSGTDAIVADMVNVKRVVYNDQRWGWGWAREYGLCPDYLIGVSGGTDIKAGTNCQFWLTVNVPENSRPGLYKGKVTVSSDEKPSYQIPLSVEVLPIRLLENKIGHLVYHSPFYRDYHRDRVSVYQDMKIHGLKPIFHPKGRVIRTGTRDVTVRLDAFEQELRTFRSVYSQAKRVFVALADYSVVWIKLGGPEPRYEYRFPQFEQTYGRILLKYAAVARDLGLEPVFSFMDEPGLDPYKRRIAYLCSSIARKVGLRTWAGIYPYANKQLTLTAGEKSRGINYLRPTSEVMDIVICTMRLRDGKFLEQMKREGKTTGHANTYVCTSVLPVYNRFLNGLYPHAMEASYVLSYAYRDDLADAYDDMDAQATHTNRVGMNDYL